MNLFKLILETTNLTSFSKFLYCIFFVFFSSTFSTITLNSSVLLNADADAPTQSQADVLLGTLPELRGPQDVLP